MYVENQPVKNFSTLVCNYVNNFTKKQHCLMVFVIQEVLKKGFNSSRRTILKIMEIIVMEDRKH